MKKFAIPVENGKLCTHFGHCQQFAIVNVTNEDKMEESYIAAPPHQPGLLPKWLGEMGITNIIAGGIGQKAINLFHQQNIEVTVGVPSNSPKEIVKDWYANSLQTGVNVCDH